MSLRFSNGPYANYQFTQATGTRLEIMQGLQYALNLAGWTTISSSTSTIIMQTQTTPESLAMRVKIYDPGSGSARVQIMNVSQALTSGDCWLTPAANKTGRVVACPYQFFIYTQMSMYNACEFVAAGTPALPPWLVGVTTECGWMSGNAIGDGGGLVYSFRNGYLPGDANYYTRWSGFRSTSSTSNMINRNANDDYYDSGDLVITSSVPGRSTYDEAGYQSSWPCQRWIDGTMIFADTYIIFGTTSSLDEGKIQGQMWDAASCSVVFTGDTCLNIGGHAAIAITHNQTSYGAGYSGQTVPGTLFIAYT